jgi:hypothetical protein
MWLVNSLVLMGGIAFSLLQNPTPVEQNPSQKKSAPTAAGQLAPASAKPEQPAAPAVAVDPAQPVITIHGLCGEGTHTSGDRAGACNKVISREQFEGLMNALNPGGQPVPQGGRQNLAQAYVEALTFADAARTAGLEDTPQFREYILWVRLRATADFYRRSLQEEYRNPSAEEIDAYYSEHLPAFEKVKLARILVPREDPSAQDKIAFDKKALEAATSARQRAARGDDPAQIQKDVYSTLGLGTPPVAELGSYRRADFIEKERAEVFALHQGEVSQVETELRSYVIYKVLAKETLPQSQVKAEITREISQQKFRDAIKAITGSTHPEFNELYFGPGMVATPPAEEPVLPRRPPSR